MEREDDATVADCFEERSSESAFAVLAGRIAWKHSVHVGIDISAMARDGRRIRYDELYRSL
ncbi:hypothetical protein SAMN05216218_1119 [Halorientalis regularis]|uniref:Uncharacterized protein n=1 Tax=Halorientalis regularis TaxID=660518 RepID=A0A1G7PTB5_9EURY|nr:hypothetical protein SAMN05216218_1119 [Halorientalis regularis]